MNREELLNQVCKKLDRPKEDFIWSESCGNPTTMRHNKELNTCEMDMGYYVVKLK